MMPLSIVESSEVDLRAVEEAKAFDQLSQACKNPQCTRLAQLKKNNLLRNGILSGSGCVSPAQMINPPFTYR